jgi:L-lactate dehydrogenase complex protein LldF
LLTAMIHGGDTVKDLAHASSLCGACADACPVRIDIPRMLIELRNENVEHRVAPRGERLIFRLFARLLTRPRLYRLAAPLGRLAQLAFIRAGAIRSLPGLFGEWTRTRDLPPVAQRTFTELWAELERER